MRKILLLIILVLCGGAQAQEPALDFDQFQKLPIQHEGRIKPIDSFARGFLNMISGSETIDGSSANEFLAQILFDPGEAMQRPVFRLLRPQILGLEPHKSRLYSYAEIIPALAARSKDLEKLAQTPETEWSKDQHELARLQESSILYGQLLRSFSLALPLNIAPPVALAKEWKTDPAAPFTLQDYKRHQKSAENKIKDLVQKKGEDPENYTASEKEIADFAFKMKILEQAGENNIFFRILPGTGKEWFSPWALSQAGQATPKTTEYMEVWQNMAMSYVTGHSDRWNTASAAAYKMAKDLDGVHSIGLEIIYNTIHPLNLSMLFYLFSFFAYVAFGMMGTKGLKHASFVLLCTGGVLHAAAIAARVIILSRPPVGTLYESILFVALVCVMIAIMYEVFRKDGIGVVMGALSGLMLLFCAKGFADEDTLVVLTAVLNTNFWLATHVLCITMGYGFCLITSMVAHFYLFLRVRGKDAQHLVTPLKLMALVALLFTAVGTILGGIWADQSWGRFWGWDPKENGALLIVLWLLWLLHGRIAGQINQALFAGGMAALSIVVAVAWFGVNLLSVGLHSYGFITGIAGGLALFCTTELCIIAALLWADRKRTVST